MISEPLAVLLFTAFANVALALIVWVKNSAQRVNQYFALMSLSAGVWALSNGFVITYAGKPSGILWARTAFVSASLIPVAFFMFASVFPAPKLRPSVAIMRIHILSGVVASVASLTPLIAQGTSSQDGALRMAYGPAHPLFALYFIGAVAHGFVLLYRKLTILTGIERLQVRYVFLAVSIALVGGTVSNVFVPVVFHSSRFSQYGPLFSIPTIALIAHTIIRYRLMNIRLVIRRSVAYVLALCTAAAIFSALFFALSVTLHSPPHNLPLGIEVVLALLVAIAFQPIQRTIEKWLNRYLFREPYDYQRTVRETSRTMATILDPHPLLAYTCEAISKTLQPEHVSVYTRAPRTLEYERVITHTTIILPTAPVDVFPGHMSQLARLLHEERHLHVAREIAQRGDPDVGDINKELQTLRADLVVPFFQDDEVSGFFVVGRTLSGDPYFTEDMDLLTTVVSQVTIALKNAKLYSQVVLVNEYVENILGAIESGVVAVDADGNVTLFNSAAERVTGISSTPGALPSLARIPSSIGELLRGTLKDRTPRTEVETTVHTTAGGDVPILCSTSPLRNRNGATLGAVAVFSDLTRLKTLESEKRQAERLASIGALASGIAHEIKNPLVAIKTFAELLPERFGEEDFRNDFASVMITEIERIDDLVARLRGLASPIAQHLAPLDIRLPIEETLALLRGQLEQSRVTVGVDIPSNCPLILGDFAQLKQLFLNLLLNALDAIGTRGHIQIKVTPNSVMGHETVRVEITDTGCGIPDNVLGRVFDPFVTTKQGGSGLGLSICRGITDAHKATIRADNNISGRGAMISLEFPALQNVQMPSSLQSR